MNKTRWGVVVLLFALAALCLNYAGYLFWLGALYPFPPNPSVRNIYLLQTIFFLVTGIAFAVSAAAILIKAYREKRKNGKSAGEEVSKVSDTKDRK